jgi:hypothetical protein
LENKPRPSMAYPDPVADALEVAFEDEIRLLFRNLVECLADNVGAPTAGGEQKCLQRFTAGLNLARRARELALTVPAPAPIASAASASTKKAT